LIALYRRLLRNVRSINQLNRVHIALENVMTPSLAGQLSPQNASSPATSLLAIRDPSPDAVAGAALGDLLYVRAEEWRERLFRHQALARKADPEPFMHHRLRRDLFLFSDPAAKAPKHLLIVFTGGALRPMMPVHAFLQHLDAAGTDVLFLRDPRRNGFRHGLFGVGASLEAVVDRLPELIDLTPYKGISTFGDSAGGMPALLAGLVLGARSILSVGGGHPNRWEYRGRPLAEGLAALRDAAGHRSKVFLMRGEQAPDDEPAAKATASLIGATILIVSDKNGPVRHSAVFPLAEQGRLTYLLEALLSASTAGLALAVPSISISEVGMERAG